MPQIETIFVPNEGTLPDNLKEYQVKINGVEDLDITDDDGHVGTYGDFISLGVELPNVDYSRGSDISHDMQVFTGDGYSCNIKFRASDWLRIDILTGPSNEAKSIYRVVPEQAIRYLSLHLPKGKMVRLRFGPEGFEDLRYDADDDGVFETVVEPTINVTGTQARDLTPPQINVDFTVQNNIATVTINATDNETGIRRIRYTPDEREFYYTGPFTIDLNESQLILVVAEDGAGNESRRFKWLDITPPTTTAVLSPTPSADGWNNTDVAVTLNALDTLGGSRIDSITYSATGAQTISETTMKFKDPPLTFPRPSTAQDIATTNLTITEEGTTTVTFFAKDKAGNIESTKTITVKIDRTAPTVQIRELITPTRQAVIEATDNSSGVKAIFYSFDGQNYLPYVLPVALNPILSQRIYAYAEDKANNRSEIVQHDFGSLTR